MAIRFLAASERRAQPWKNGGGITREIAASPDGAALDAFDWRVSMAEVAAAGPFSRFEGVDRILTVLTGELELSFPGRPRGAARDAWGGTPSPSPSPATAIARARRAGVRPRTSTSWSGADPCGRRSDACGGKAPLTAHGEALLVLALEAGALEGRRLDPFDALLADAGETLTPDAAFGMLVVELSGCDLVGPLPPLRGKGGPRTGARGAGGGSGAGDRGSEAGRRVRVHARSRSRPPILRHRPPPGFRRGPVCRSLPPQGGKGLTRRRRRQGSEHADQGEDGGAGAGLDGDARAQPPERRGGIGEGPLERGRQPEAVEPGQSEHADEDDHLGAEHKAPGRGQEVPDMPGAHQEPAVQEAGRQKRRDRRGPHARKARQRAMERFERLGGAKWR